MHEKQAATPRPMRSKMFHHASLQGATYGGEDSPEEFAPQQTTMPSTRMAQKKGVLGPGRLRPKATCRYEPGGGS